MARNGVPRVFNASDLRRLVEPPALTMEGKFYLSDNHASNGSAH